MTTRKVRTSPEADPVPGYEYVLGSSDFLSFITTKRDLEQRAIDDLSQEIDGYVKAIERRNTDTARANGADEVEIAARRRHIDDKSEIIRACDAALAAASAPPARIGNDSE